MAPPKMIISTTSGGKAHASDGDWKAPRLSLAILRAPAGACDEFRTTLEKAVNQAKDKGGRDPVLLQEQDADKFKAELKVLCGHLDERLKGTLAEAWAYAYSRNDPDGALKKVLIKAAAAGKKASDVLDASTIDLKSATDFYDSGEEQWARAFCEMAIFNMYHTPAQGYNTPVQTSSRSDILWYQAFPSVYPVTMACQTLATYCVLSRGFGLDQVANLGVSCSAGSASVKAFNVKKPLIKPMVSPSTITEADVPADTPEKDKKAKLAALRQADLAEKGGRGENLGNSTFGTAKALVSAGATPGSVLIYNLGGADFNGQLAKCPGGGITHVAPVLRVTGQKLQFVDTGVTVGNGESSNEAGTIDHDFLTGTVASPSSVVAFGFGNPPAGDLTDWATKIGKAKPAAFARLVIFAPDRNLVLFVSKLLHMRWPVSKLIWSLRCSAPLPYKGITVAWFVWLPRDKKVSDALRDALAGTPAAPSSLISKRCLVLANAILSKDNGEIAAYRCHQFAGWKDEANQSNWPKVLRDLTLASGVHLIDLPFGAPDGPKMDGWCETPDNFDKCYVRTMKADDAGNASNGKVDHELVDP